MNRFPASAARLLAVISVIAMTACGGNDAPVVRPTPPPPSPDGIAPPPQVAGNQGNRPPAPPTPASEPVPVPPEPLREELLSTASLDDLNRNSPLKPLFFELDSAEISREGQLLLDENGAVLKRNSGWTVTIEGHCDERGTAEYNLGLGERRAVAARAYLISIGIAADRLRTVSYGKEFPFDPGHEEASRAKNRRAHFVITAK